MSMTLNSQLKTKVEQALYVGENILLCSTFRDTKLLSLLKGLATEVAVPNNEALIEQLADKLLDYDRDYTDLLLTDETTKRTD